MAAIEIPCTWKLMTPAGVAGAVAIIQITGDVPRALAAMELPPLEIGAITLRSLLGIDHALIARISESCLQLMPHGGTFVVREVLAALIARGIGERSPDAAFQDFPEARDEIESRMLHALAHASSPLAVDLLLDQPRRWREVPGANVDVAPSRTLNHLLTPPLVVMVGPANVGKSTLLNRLAGRGVAIVADEPGTTRDHVGALLDLGGLVVRFVDTPGVRNSPDAIEAQAMHSARRLAEQADLVLLVADAHTQFPAMPTLDQSAIRVGLRSDRGATAGAAVSVSALSGEGLDALSRLIRDTLVPADALADPRPWRFWEG